jgi:peptidyl-prolyl cis-trans isomerase SurA
MLRKSILWTFVVALVVVLGACTAKKEASVLKIYHGNALVDAVTPEEFLAVFTKNNVSGEELTRESVEEYLDLFINYKLKVKEAEALGMDTLPGFTKELSGYREQLARPYLTDESVTDRLINEAYERMQFDVRASHILVSLPREATPADTVKAYQRILQAREQLLQGASFVAVASEYSDDPYAKDIPPTETSPGRKGNHGDLGYFTVFDMVYPFENAAYNTPVGEISEIVRSTFGYHVLKVTDKKPAMGRVFLAHVYVPHPRTGDRADSLETRRRIHEIHDEWLKGEITFEELAKNYSEDRNNSHNGGVLRWFNTHGLVPQFVSVLNDMDTGMVSAPVETMYGWHILRLLQQERPGTLEMELPNIRQRLSRDVRAQLSRDEAIAQIKADFGYREYPKNRDLIARYVDTTIFADSWNAEASGMLKNRKPLFKIGDETYTVAQFGSWLMGRQSRTLTGDLPFLLNERYNEYADSRVLAYKEERLEELYPEFRALMQEYRDGILLFDLMDRKVWSYAVQDTTGLESFYELHKHDHRWDTRVDAAIYIFKDLVVAEQAKGYLMEGMNEQEILDTVNKTSALALTIRKGKYQAGDNVLVDAHPRHAGITELLPLPENAPGYPGYYFVHVKEILPPGYKELGEVRGLMISMYQEQLEKDWMEQLKEKYRVEVVTEELKKLHQ